MKLVHTVEQWNPLWISHIQKNHRIGLIPTMGALHEGHLDLVRRSLQKTDVSIVSIFVNPIQFNNPEDFAKYPATLDQDLEKLRNLGVQYVFVPDVKSMYASLPQLKMDFGDLERVLEGKFRPGHFNGVGIVVSKLFHLIRPHHAFFGQKDLQQVAIIKRLVTDLSFQLELEVVETKRESDGLAMSSRNLRLSPEDRVKALLLSKSLNFAKTELLAGQSWLSIREKIQLLFDQEEDCQLEYMELVHPETFQIQDQLNSSVKSSICIAAFVGEVRLIDNLPIVA